jgi:serine/threonine-protein kinase
MSGSDPTLRAPGSGLRPSPLPHAAPPEVAAADPSAKFGKFVRTKRLGSGGMGEVWKAWDAQLSRWVALKFLKGSDEEEISRFEREAQLAARLSHPNIAAIYEVGSDQGRHWIAMQFIAGRTLRGYPRTDLRAIIDLIHDAARAVAVANRAGIIHRDLKPENLMLTETGRKPHVYVMDFGLARATEGASDLSVSGSIVGTPAYMPPEQARGQKVDGRSDVYALGATLYELLSGKKPFQGANVYETLRASKRTRPCRPRATMPASTRISRPSCSSASRRSPHAATPGRLNSPTISCDGSRARRSSPIHPPQATGCGNSPLATALF